MRNNNGSMFKIDFRLNSLHNISPLHIAVYIVFLTVNSRKRYQVFYALTHINLKLSHKNNTHVNNNNKNINNDDVYRPFFIRRRLIRN